uniref:Uncharacterized protein n=1 Tax=Nannospalax galili TaxID=1026970 RepID=A0A8C6QTI6_NANGA
MPGCDHSLFKVGIEPMWEDEKNKPGGPWLITLNKHDDVCGAVVNVRAKDNKIAIWTTECENREAVTHIGRVYKERLGLPPKLVIGYQSHADTGTKSGSTTKNRFVKKTPSRYSHRRPCQAMEIWELNQSLIKAEWIALKLDPSKCC